MTQCTVTKSLNLASSQWPTMQAVHRVACDANEVFVIQDGFSLTQTDMMGAAKTILDKMRELAVSIFKAPYFCGGEITVGGDLYEDQVQSRRNEYAFSKRDVMDTQRLLTGLTTLFPEMIPQLDAWQIASHQNIVTLFDLYYAAVTTSDIGATYFFAKSIVEQDDCFSIANDGCMHIGYTIRCRTDGLMDGCPWSNDVTTLPPLLETTSP